ncbi:MAG: hypothetical protein Q8O57_06270, partial [Kiritimatiellota bacterium]|nr:hypothetical protein [Kiritimatiellota bacterium]
MKSVMVWLAVWALASGLAMGQDDGGPPVGMKLDTNADGIWDHTYLGNDGWDPPLTGMLPPGTLMDSDGDNVADAILVD